MNKSLRNLALFLLGLLLGVAIAWLIREPSEKDLSEQEYCRMVEMYKQDPTTGWPDFNNNYNEVCNAQR